MDILGERRRGGKAALIWVFGTLLFGCDDAGESGSADTGVMTCPEEASPAPYLACPHVEIPFSTQGSEFENEATADLVASNPDPKDRNLDVLLNPGAPIVIEGRAARGRGLVERGLAGEWISNWTYSARGDWVELGRVQTDMSGQYSMPIQASFGPGLHATYTVTEGLDSCALQLIASWPAETQVVITDIDETLTTSDTELIKLLTHSSYDIPERPGASEMLNAWADKGYKIIYLTARPHGLRQASRVWLDTHGFPLGPVISSENTVSGASAQTYKARALQRIKDELGWDVVAVYGNAETDIGAYAEAGIDSAVTFIIGRLSGADGIQGIDDGGYGMHQASYVAEQPMAVQSFEFEAFCE